MVFLTLPDKHKDLTSIINHFLQSLPNSSLCKHTSNDIKPEILTALYRIKQLPQFRKFFIFNNAQENLITTRHTGSQTSVMVIRVQSVSLVLLKISRLIQYFPDVTLRSCGTHQIASQIVPFSHTKLTTFLYNFRLFQTGYSVQTDTFLDINILSFTREHHSLTREEEYKT